MWLLLVAVITSSGLGSHSPVQIERRTIGAWTLVVYHNNFTGAVNCTLKGKSTEVEGGALVLHFGQSVDTSTAWFRIGAAEAKSWRRLIPELRQMGVKLRFDDLENPSQGRVPIPLRLVTNASVVLVAPTERTSPRTFVISGLTDALERGNARGCAFPMPGPLLVQNPSN